MGGIFEIFGVSQHCSATMLQSLSDSCTRREKMPVSTWFYSTTTHSKIKSVLSRDRERATVGSDRAEK